MCVLLVLRCVLSCSNATFSWSVKYVLTRRSDSRRTRANPLLGQTATANNFLTFISYSCLNQCVVLIKHLDFSYLSCFSRFSPGGGTRCHSHVIARDFWSILPRQENRREEASVAGGRWQEAALRSDSFQPSHSHSVWSHSSFQKCYIRPTY